MFGMYADAEVVAGSGRVLFPVGTSLATVFITIDRAPWRCVITRRNDVAFARKDRTDMTALAVGPGAHTNGN